MPIIIKTEQEISYMREGGKILAKVLNETLKQIKEGVSTEDLDIFAEKMIKEHGALPAFKGYKGFPNTLCTSIDEEVVHGIPKKDRILKEGDLLKIDCGIIYKGLYLDAARSIIIGHNVPTVKDRLIKTAQMALSKAIDIAKPGINLNKISETIQNTIESAGFKVIYDLTGHGVGRTLHEEPIILNYIENKPNPVLKEGMTLAIEPIFSVSSNEIEVLKDNWTIVTKDRSFAVQEENTILITKDGNEILTI